MVPSPSPAHAGFSGRAAGQAPPGSVADQLEAICMAADSGLADSALAGRLAQIDSHGKTWIERLWDSPPDRDAWFGAVFRLRQAGHVEREFKELLRAPLAYESSHFELGTTAPSPCRSEYPMFHTLMGLHRDDAARYLGALLDAAMRHWLSDRDLIDLAQGNAMDIPLDRSRKGAIKRPRVHPGALNYAVQNGQTGNVTAFMTFLLEAVDRRLLSPSQALDLATRMPTDRKDAVQRGHKDTLDALDRGIARLEMLNASP